MSSKIFSVLKKFLPEAGKAVALSAIMGYNPIIVVNDAVKEPGFMDYTTFKNNLRLLVESRGMTVQGFCEDVGIPHATISRYLSGDREPKSSYLIKIAEYFNVSLDWLLGMSGEKFDVMPKEIQEVVSLYSLASPDDRRVIHAVLNKYRKE